MAEDFASLILEMLQNPPDPNEPVPLFNYKSTMFGVTIPFHALTWLMVAFRLHTRLQVVRDPGWDDLFVVLAAVFNLVSLIAFLGGTYHGLGLHLVYVLGTLRETMLWLYITGAAYHTTTALIKVSLLLQYLRLFRDGARRKVCIILLVIVTIWGFVFSFMAWVPCFPVSGFWNRQTNPPPKCYAFGYPNVTQAKHSVLVFAGTNMALDLAIFLVPLSIYFRRDLGRKQLLAMTGLFALGSIVILMSILRLWSAFKHSKTGAETFDFTYWYPEVLILACLEVDFAIMSASMPIFWPTVVASWSQIFVTNEVRVTHHERLDDTSKDNYQLKRTDSSKSTASTAVLTSVESSESNPFYLDFDNDLGKGKNAAITRIEVEPQSQRKRHL